MRAYETRRLEQFPDVADIREEGRKGCIGRVSAEPCGKFKSYIRKSKNRKMVRRLLRRRDRNRAIRAELRLASDDN